MNFNQRCNPMKINLTNKKSGFTLVETVIAMGIIAVLITAFLGAFGPAIQGVQKAISTKEVNRLASTLENEFVYLKPGDEKQKFTSGFHKAYTWIEDQGSDSEAVLLYQYRGDPASPRADGTLEPISDISAQIPGRDYVLQSVARRLSDGTVSDELQPGVVEGRVFYVKMTQLVFEEDGLQLGTIGTIIDPTLDVNGGRDSVSSFQDYPEAVIAYQAEFYVLRSNIFAYVSNGFSLNDRNGDGHPDATGRSVFTRNMAVRR